MSTLSLFDTAPRFDGAVYDPAIDDGRLRRQLARVFGVMRDGQARTLHEIAAATGDPEASVSAQLRNLRKPRFGGYTGSQASADRARRFLGVSPLPLDRTDAGQHPDALTKIVSVPYAKGKVAARVGG